MRHPNGWWNGPLDNVWRYWENGEHMMSLARADSTGEYSWMPMYPTPTDNNWQKIPNVRTLEEAQAVAIADWRLG